jgi:phosphoglycerate dehydrogenase-like enzyme
MRTPNVYAVWLEWPEKCFRAGDEEIRFLRSLVPEGSRIVRARSEEAFLKMLPEATHAIVWHFREEWFARAPKLKVLATPSAGKEFLPKKGPKGVKVHFGAFHGPIISETVLGFMLAWSRGFFWKGPLWRRAELSERCGDLAGTTAVIAGFGRIGRAIAARIEPFGVTCYGITRHGIFEVRRSRAREINGASLRNLYRRADWFILALPSDTGTDDFLDEGVIRQLPKRSVVINIGRGNSVDERALLAALRDGRLAGAYLDVFKQEPTALNPKVGPNGRGLAALKSVPPNLVRMPHSSAFTPRYLKECFKELAHEGLLNP